MAKILRPRRGSTAANAGLVGGNGEITIDTDKSTIRVHDGATAGGTEMARMKDVPTKVSELENDANFTQFAGASATVDANTGTPSVTVTESGSGNNKGLVFSFKNLKGAKGDKGDKGDTGATGPQGPQGATGALGTISGGAKGYALAQQGVSGFYTENLGTVGSGSVTQYLPGVKRDAYGRVVNAGYVVKKSNCNCDCTTNCDCNCQD